MFGARDLAAEVIEWKYQVTIVPDPDEPARTGRFLYLECRTSESHFLRYGTELFLRIYEENQKPNYNKVVMARSGDSKSHEGKEVGHIIYSSINYEDDNYEGEISPYLEGDFKISSEHFQHILDILNNAQGKNLLKVKLQLSLYGLDLGYELEMDKWPDEKELSIVNVAFGLGTNSPEEDKIR
jgi:hypothetical protein